MGYIKKYIIHLKTLLQIKTQSFFPSIIFLTLNLSLISFPSHQQEYGRILVTTGCHPAEPDVLGSLAILEYLASPAATNLLQNYTVDIMPMQNPDGYKLKSCLTANGINLYWNFRHQDQLHCPEAYFLWQDIKKNPPLHLYDKKGTFIF